MDEISKCYVVARAEAEDCLELLKMWNSTADKEFLHLACLSAAMLQEYMEKLFKEAR